MVRDSCERDMPPGDTSARGELSELSEGAASGAGAQIFSAPAAGSQDSTPSIRMIGMMRTTGCFFGTR